MTIDSTFIFKVFGTIFGLYLAIGAILFTLVDFTIDGADKEDWESIPWLKKFIFTVIFWLHIFLTINDFDGDKK